MSIFTKEH